MDLITIDFEKFNCFLDRFCSIFFRHYLSCLSKLKKSYYVCNLQTLLTNYGAHTRI